MNKFDVGGYILFRNEEETLLRAINDIYPWVDKLVLCDDCSEDNSVKIADDFIRNADKDHKTKLVKIPKILSDMWAFHSKKNYTASFNDTYWQLCLDADEVIEIDFYKSLKKLISQDEIQVYFLPRLNYIDGVLVNEDDDKDYQGRLYRSFCVFHKPVHEEIVGYNKEHSMKLEGNFHIIHKKTSSRQKTQNERYTNLAVKFHKQVKPIKDE